MIWNDLEWFEMNIIIYFPPLVPKLSAQAERLGTHLLKKLRFNTPPAEVPLSNVLSPPPACIEYYLGK